MSKSKSNMNTKLLRRVKRHILAEPKRLAMSQWVQFKNEYEPKVNDDSYGDNCELHPFAKCGTAACIAGWAVLLEAKNPKKVTEYEVEDRAIELLGLEPERFNEETDRWEESQAKRLFYVDDWPEKYEKMYAEAKTPAGKARAAARRIEHFIATGGAE